MVRICKVVEDSEVDGEDAHCGDGDGNGGDDPGDVVLGFGGPAEHEEAEGEEDALETAKVEAVFGDGGPVFAAGGEVVLEEGEGHGEDASYAGGGEDGVGVGEAEAVCGLEDEGDDGEIDEEDGPAEGGPEGEEEDDWLSEEEDEGPRDGRPEQLDQADTVLILCDSPSDARSLFRLWEVHSAAAGCLELFVPLVQFLCSLPQDGYASGFFEKENDSESDHASNDDLDVEDPPPCCVIGNEPADQGTQACSKEGAE